MEIVGHHIRFNAFNISDTYTDLHIHSTWSDGINSIVEIVQGARIKNLRIIAITDHVRRKSTYFTGYCDEIRKIGVSDLSILIGFEAKIKNFQGNLDVSSKVRKMSDLQIGSVHRFPLGRKLISPKDLSKRICQEVELELSVAAIKKQQMDILGHPGGMSLKEFGEFPMEFFREIIVECSRNDIIFELNSAYHAAIYWDLQPMLQEHNPYVSFGSDAHTLEEIGKWSTILRQGSGAC
ncbi:MAG: PHP domain-containing protein [Desulfobacterales bacterium]|nr:PHP domain-containing protein [Desulfobacterales bacterium]